MTSFLFIISFLLHIISITAIYALVKQLAVVKENSTSSDIVELMESYLDEIKQENQSLQEQLSKNEEESNPREVILTPEKNINSFPIQEDLNDGYQIPVLEEQVQDNIEVSQQSRILKLYAEGTSIEEIARKLGCGKTEVELILKFHEKSNI
ncbi:helix-turn-helix domain-containing protein [Paucisalibacillus globulus]|uniref:helix-turn-helix domain-containing protein n=1 Tax=Paucisalibacillus globulus TaxID=351095 RepID=UPI00040423CB|nr:helix-turn-helix domain-containing protein [Paucisalibacillus globulus]